MRKHLPFIVGLLCGLGLTAYAATNVSLTKDHVLEYLNYIGDSLVIGNTATTTASRLEVNGQATALNFNATSTSVASTFPYASTTMVTGTSALFTGSSTLQTLNSSALTLGALSGVLKATAGLVSGGASTSDLPEGTNEYFTIAKARSAVSGLFAATATPWTAQQVAYVNDSGNLTSVATGTISGTSPISVTAGRYVLGGAASVSIADAVADGATKGAATFVANDFTSSAGNIGIDYTNGQAAGSGAKGFLTSTDWSTFNGKVSTTVTLGSTYPILGGGDLSSNRTFSLAFGTTTSNTWASTQTFSAIAGSIDAGGATSFEIPNAAGPTVDTLGEIGLDTTDNQLLVADSGGTARVIALEQSLFSFTAASTSYAFATGGNLPVPKWVKEGRSLTQFKCWVEGGTSVVLSVTDGTNATETITCASAVTADTDVATNDTFTADEKWYVDFGTVTGTVNYVTFEAYGYLTRE